ncbi:ParB N-terminal domain-containing protein [Acaryochloris marina]|uniref:ParB-like N-terminal domain-containing protein n=1 Tax=Acaryochloris marina (strain MBIC 11017) TaxID=329726 RepID=A8ZND4_ACAM1|nr:ParB N-terminal domain-containing protein [Acaryochloris marina]ABW32520.1 hypothetical protein AM1_D0023 [Acaryochloris marina MBIC11017]
MPPKKASRELHEVSTQSVEIAEIRMDGGTQPRAKLFEEVVDDYAQDMKQGATFPPVIVYFDGEEYWLADGFHRVRAKEAIGETSVTAEVHLGTQRDAVLYAVGANAAHGLRRTNADKRRAVIRLLRDFEWREWSDREIARRCGVDHKTVGSLRKDIYPTDDQSKEFRKGADGRITNVSNIGKSTKTINESNKRQRRKKPAATLNTIVEQSQKVQIDDIWRLGKSHLLFCGDSGSAKFQKLLPIEISLLLFFPRKDKPWLPEKPTNVHNTLLFHTSYGEDLHLETLRGIIENCLSGTTDANDPIVMINLIDPSLFILIDELECSCFCAEPDPQRCTDALTVWTAINQTVKKIST